MQATLPIVLALQLAVGLMYPKTAAAWGITWSLGRVLYLLGERGLLLKPLPLSVTIAGM
jgi:hypothetical protein